MHTAASFSLNLRRVGRTVALALLTLSACSALFPPPVVPGAAAGAGRSGDGSALPAADVVTAVDAQPADSAGPADTAFPVDAAVDSGEAVDAVAVDAAPPCVWPACEPADCDTLRATIDALAQQQTGCSVAAGCTLFEFPICGSFGCYTTPIASDAPPDQVAALSELALIGEKLQCPGFHCGCGPMPLPYCLSGKCRQCPPDCGDSCSGLLAAILHQAKQLSYYCKTSADCVGVDSPICTEPSLPCYKVAVNKSAKHDQLDALLAAYATNGCVVADCGCGGPDVFACVDGYCQQTAP